LFLDIGEWNVSSVIYMSRMFYTASAFNQNLSSWSVSYVTYYSRFIKIIHKWKKAVHILQLGANVEEIFNIAAVATVDAQQK
jgi:hypothetical protein